MADRIAPIRDVSETALWVAYHRALETKRRKALFRDPYAAVLAGERGAEIARTMPNGKSSAWSTVVRTYLIDEIVLRLVNEGSIDTVLNLGAGLDTRPYRLELPQSLHWVEVDLPGVIAYKQEKLVGTKPACHLRSVGMDLANVKAASGLFAEIGAKMSSVLVLSEGLLTWLSREEASALAHSLHARPNFDLWLLDLLSAPLGEWMAKSKWGAAVNAGGLRMPFAPVEGPAFFTPLGWQVAELRSLGDTAHRLGREAPLAWLWRLMIMMTPKDRRETQEQPDSHVVLLRRAG